MAVRIDADRVEMEVVDVAGGLDGDVEGFVEPHVVEAVPLEEHATGGDVDLLHDPLDESAVDGATDRREVGADLVVDRDQCRVSRRDHDLVEVGLVAVASPDPGDLVVRRVGDHERATVAAEDGALPPCQHRRAAIALDAEVDRGHLRARLEPERLAEPIEDQRAARLRGGRRRGKAERGEEDSAPSLPGAGGEDLDRGREQVRPGDEVVGGGIGVSHARTSP